MIFCFKNKNEQLEDSGLAGLVSSFESHPSLKWKRLNTIFLFFLILETTFQKLYWMFQSKVFFFSINVSKLCSINDYRCKATTKIERDFYPLCNASRMSSIAPFGSHFARNRTLKMQNLLPRSHLKSLWQAQMMRQTTAAVSEIFVLLRKNVN